MTSNRNGSRAALAMGLALSILLAAVIAVAWTTLWPRHVSEQAMTQVAVVVDGEEVAHLVERLLSGQFDPPYQSGEGQAGETAQTAQTAQTLPGQAEIPALLQGDGQQQNHLQEDLLEMAGLQGPAFEDPGAAWEAVLQGLREAGVTGVGLHEWTLSDAASKGQVFLVTKADLDAMESPLALRLPPGLPGDAIVVGWGSKADPWVVQALARLLPQVAVELPPNEFDDTPLWLLPDVLPARIVLGLHPGEVERIRRAGLDIVPRIQGEAFETPEELQRRFQGLGDGPILFKGVQAAGFPHHVTLVGSLLREAGSSIGLIEFAPQRGLNQLARLVDYRAVRVHSITDREMQAGIDQKIAVERWLRAVRERQVRLLYVRLFPDVSLEENLEYLAQIAQALEDAGYHLGRPSLPAAPATPWWKLASIALVAGACAGWVGWILIARALWPARTVQVVCLVGGALLACGAFAAFWLKGYTVLARQGIALLVALSFPVASTLIATRAAGSPPVTAGRGAAAGPGATGGPGATANSLAALSSQETAPPSENAGSPEGGVPPAIAVLAATGSPRATASPAGTAVPAVAVGPREAAAHVAAAGDRDRPTEQVRGIPQPPSMPSRLVRAAAGFLLAGAVTLLGALCVATLLTEVRFLLKIEEFRGVKLAHLAPLVTLAVILAAPVLGLERLFSKREESRSWLRSFLALFRSWMNQTIRVWELCAALVILAFVGVYLVRTGNEGLPVPALEAALRRWLEESFFARPRTKEVFIGHPALVVALAFWREKDTWRSRALRIGTHALLILGAIGQISIINTFAHAHTALLVSLARTFFGAILGLLLGVAAVLALAWVVDRRRGWTVEKEKNTRGMAGGPKGAAGKAALGSQGSSRSG